MALPVAGVAGRGLALGAWGAAQATALGLAVAAGGILRDIVNALALSGQLGDALSGPGTGYSFVYHLEIGLLFVTLIALGPLVRSWDMDHATNSKRTGIGLADLPA